MRLFILFVICCAALISCKEPTVETSIYKNDIYALDSAFKKVDSVYTIFTEEIDKEKFHLILSKASNKIWSS